MKEIETSKEKDYHSIKKILLSYNNMNIMRKQKLLCDVNIKIGTKNLFAHKLVLASHCEYFDKMFTGNFKESNVQEITLNNIESSAFELLVDYMYTLILKITEENVQDLLVASKFILFNDIYNECIQFMKENINVDNCLETKCFAHSNDEYELEELCLFFILDNFTDLRNSIRFMSMTFDEIIELIQNDYIKVKEEKDIYESIISWVKYDINNRSHFLSELIKFVRMPWIPVSYFINNIENEDIIKSYCKPLLYEALKMYAVKSTGPEFLSCTYNFNQRKYTNNQLILITSVSNNGDWRLEWITTGNKMFPIKEFTWKAENPSIILNDGRIFCIKYCQIHKHLPTSIFDGKSKQWDTACIFKFFDNYDPIISLVNLNVHVYMMTNRGCFMSYNINESTWLDLERIDYNFFFFASNGLIVLNELIYYISDSSVFQYNPNINKWKMVSQENRNLGFCFTACSLNGYLYVMGSEKNKKSVMKFDPSNNTWSNIANMNHARLWAGAVAVNGLIYVMGGQKNDSYEIYDPQYDKWTLSENKLISNDRATTRAYILIPESNITQENVSNYYSI